MENINLETLALALRETALKRGSEAIVRQYREIMEVVKNSEALKRQWSNYRKDFYYATNIEFSEACDVVARVMNNLLI